MYRRGLHPKQAGESQDRLRRARPFETGLLDIAVRLHTEVEAGTQVHV